MKNNNLEIVLERFVENNRKRWSEEGCVCSPGECALCPELFKQSCLNNTVLENLIKLERKKKLEKLLS